LLINCFALRALRRLGQRYVRTAPWPFNRASGIDDIDPFDGLGSSAMDIDQLVASHHPRSQLGPSPLPPRSQLAQGLFTLRKAHSCRERWLPRARSLRCLS
jgi:hypothetical protein